MLKEKIVEQNPVLLRVTLPDDKGDYELTLSPVLIQAVGCCCGTDFYFRIKHGQWEFEAQDKQGHAFAENDPKHFTQSGPYEGPMHNDWAVIVLRQCLSEWRKTMR